MRLYLDGQEVEVALNDGEARVGTDRVYVKTPDGVFSGVAVRDGGKLHVSFRGRTFVFETSRPRAGAAGLGGDEIRAPMPGLVIEVLTEVGAAVSLGQKLMVLEAMKTQQPLISPREGTVASVGATAGQQVQQGDVLVRLET